jgi:hypothetical protein
MDINLVKLSFLDWCRINWKFLLGVAVPIVLILIGKKINIKEIWKQAKEAKEKEIEIINKANQGQVNSIKDAVSGYQEDVKEAVEVHGEQTEILTVTIGKKRDRISELDAEGATDELNNRFDLD